VNRGSANLIQQISEATIYDGWKLALAFWLILSILYRGHPQMRILGILALGAALGGCASVTRGTSENLNVLSNPPGATATISDSTNDNSLTCVTPCVVSVKRSADISVSATKDGYHTEGTRLKLESSAAGALNVGGNVILGGLVGIGVDTYNGAAYDHKPNPVELILKPLEPATSEPARKPRVRRLKPAVAPGT
jgi:hypothetical protein